MMHYRPLGVVGIITPWNGPFSSAINPTVQAVLAGNAVISQTIGGRTLLW